MIQHNKPMIGEKEKNAVSEVIDSGWVACGEKVKKFENNMCEYLGLENGHATAVNSGTSALYLALKALNVKQSDEVIIPSYVCTALLNAVNMIGATPIICDVDSYDFNISFNLIKNVMSSRIKAIIVPHMYGIPADIYKIKTLGIPIIEDCAQALGSKINNEHVGIIGDIAIFSFYATKVITTGYGGMIVSKNIEYINVIKDYIDFDCRENYYPRFNFKMSDINAAMGIVQLNKIDTFLQHRKQIAEKYEEVCKTKGWTYLKSQSNSFTINNFRFIIKGKKEFISNLKEYLEQNGINTIIPIEKWELLHNYLKLDKGNYPNSEIISQTTLSLPIYPQLIINRSLYKIIDVIKRK